MITDFTTLLNHEQHFQFDQQNSTAPIDYFSGLTNSVFHSLCKYLDLVDKCRVLPLLNHAITALFNPSTCCNKHDITIKFRTEGTSPVPIYSIGQLPYLKYATSIDIDFTHEDNLDDTHRALLFRSLQEAICGSNLQNLQLKFERSIDGVSTVLNMLDNSTPEQLKNLNVLHISGTSPNTMTAFSAFSRMRSKLSAPESSLTTQHWNCITNCQSLTTLNISVTGGAVDFDYLPRSLTSLSLLRSGFPESEPLAQKLKDPSFLPLLQDLNSSVFSQSIVIDALTTVMDETGKTRPIRKLMLFYEPKNNLSVFQELRDLDIEVESTKLEDLCFSFSDTCMRFLNKLKFTVRKPLDQRRTTVSAPIDISWLFLFSSTRPIKHLSVNVAGPGRLHEFLNSKLCINPLSPEAINAWLQMKSLEFLKIVCHEEQIQFQDLFGCDLIDVGYQLQGKWPCLTHMELEGSVVTNKNAMSLLSAAPGLKHLKSVNIDLFQPSLRLSNIAYLCPNIQTIVHVVSRFIKDPIPSPYLADILAVQPYSLERGSFQYLKEICYEAPIQVSVLHFLVTKLIHVPLLTTLHLRTQGVMVDIRNNRKSVWSCTITYLSMCIKLRLPHLKYLTVPEHQAICHVEYPTSAKPGPNVSCFIPKAELDDCVLFRTLSDSLSLDGRQQLLDMMLTQLSDDEIQGLTQWDAGDYTWQPDPRAAVLRVEI